jgi:Co/Zn/Cd efflux system component
MHKSTFKIDQMDCSAEEQLIRMKLADLQNIHALEFDLKNRQLAIFHSGRNDKIYQLLNSLKLGTSLIEIIEVASISPDTNNAKIESRLLWQVLLINFFCFGLELIAGFFSHSLGLVADSLDMLADSLVYGLALFAVGGSLQRKKHIARSAGYLQLALALMGFVEVVKRFVDVEEMPAFHTMIIISIIALLGNALCLFLLQKSKSNEAHMQASMIFTSNDVIVNLGVIVAGVLVYLTQSKYPDLVVGTIVFYIVGKGALKILKLAK